MEFPHGVKRGLGLEMWITSNLKWIRNWNVDFLPRHLGLGLGFGMTGNRE